jgi:hypothetical protein
MNQSKVHINHYLIISVQSASGLLSPRLPSRRVWAEEFGNALTLYRMINSQTDVLSTACQINTSAN